MFTCVSNPWWILTTTEWRHVTHVLYCDRFYLIGCKNCKTIHCYSRYFVASVLHTASHGRHIFGHYCGSQDYRSFVSRPRNRSVASVATMLERVLLPSLDYVDAGNLSSVLAATIQRQVVRTT